MNRPVHFEIQVDDVQRAIDFYTKAFGWDFEEWKGEDYVYWLIKTAEEGSDEIGINGGLHKRSAEAPKKESGANAFVTTMQVDDFDSIAKAIVAAGGTVTTPKFALPGMAWQGYFMDTEGNTFGIHQPDEKAK